MVNVPPLAHVLMRGRRGTPQVCTSKISTLAGLPRPLLLSWSLPGVQSGPLDSANSRSRACVWVWPVRLLCPLGAARAPAACPAAGAGVPVCGVVSPRTQRVAFALARVAFPTHTHTLAVAAQATSYTSSCSTGNQLQHRQPVFFFYGFRSNLSRRH